MRRRGVGMLRWGKDGGRSRVPPHRRWRGRMTSEGNREGFFIWISFLSFFWFFSYILMHFPWCAYYLFGTSQGGRQGKRCNGPLVDS